MKGLLGFLFLISPAIIVVGWIIVTWLGIKYGARFIRGARSCRSARIALLIVGAIVWISVSFWYGGGRKVYYDAQVRQLCAKDGGVKVYKRVIVPAGMFDKWGQVSFYNPSKGEMALGPDYVIRTSVNYLRRGNPSLRRYHVQVIRKIDRVVLGESIGYDRGGGDLPGPWQPSSYSCPKPHGEVVISKIFTSDKELRDE